MRTTFINASKQSDKADLSIAGSSRISNHPQSMPIATPRVSERNRYFSVGERSSRSSSMGSGYFSYCSSPANCNDFSARIKNDVLIQDSKMGYSNPELNLTSVDKTFSQSKTEVKKKILQLKNDLQQKDNELGSVITQAMINQKAVELEARTIAQRRIAEIRAESAKEQERLIAEKSTLSQKLREFLELNKHLDEVIERSRKLSSDVDCKTTESSLMGRNSWHGTSTLTPPAFSGPRPLVLRDISSPVCQLFDGNQLSPSVSPIMEPLIPPRAVKNGVGIIGDRRPSRTSPELEVPFGPLVQRQSPPGVKRTVVTTGCLRGQLSRAIKILGGAEGQEDHLCRPWGITCYPEDGRIFVVDRSNDRIVVYNSNFSLCQQFGGRGSEPGQFLTPAGAAVDVKGRLIVADKDNHRIQILTLEGKFILMFGKHGKEPGDFNYPWDVAANSKCEIVVSDSRNHRIQLFNSNGQFLRLFSFASSHIKPLDLPRSVAFTPEDDVVFTNFNTHTVMKVPKDFSGARVLAPIGRASEPNRLLRPQGIEVDSDGNIIVADSRNHRVQVFDKSGEHLWSFGEEGKEDYQMDRPAGITLLPAGNVALVDFGNNRVMVF